MCLEFLDEARTQDLVIAANATVKHTKFRSDESSCKVLGHDIECSICVVSPVAVLHSVARWLRKS